MKLLALFVCLAVITFRAEKKWPVKATHKEAREGESGKAMQGAIPTSGMFREDVSMKIEEG